MGGVHFLDWRPHNRRAESLSQDLGATLWLAPDRLRRKAFAPLRYAVLSVRTIGILLKQRPDVVIASSPPSLCPIIVYAYSKISGCKYVIDAHHLATTGFWWSFPLGAGFNRFIMQKATATLVHNRVIERLASARGVSAITLETKVPPPRAEMSNDLPSEGFSVLIPCSFDPDEPVPAIYQAAASLRDTTFYVTGDLKRLDAGLRKTAPQNVILTGFVTREKFDSLLAGCDVVLATAANDYPVRPRAASEAIAAGKPLIVSRNEATEDHFGNAAVLIQNASSEIVRALDEIRQRYDHYLGAMQKVRQARHQRYEFELSRLKEVLGVPNDASAQVPYVDSD